MIDYHADASAVSEDDLADFFVGWPNPPSPAIHLQILHNSQLIVVAREGERIVGFITALSDGILSAYIPLLEVLPSHQGQGIGSELMRRMLQRLEHLYMIDLICDPSLQTFYERFKLMKASAMMRRNYAHQRGE